MSFAFTPSYVFDGTNTNNADESYSSGDDPYDDYGIDEINVSNSFFTVNFKDSTSMTAPGVTPTAKSRLNTQALVQKIGRALSTSHRTKSIPSIPLTTTSNTVSMRCTATLPMAQLWLMMWQVMVQDLVSLISTILVDTTTDNTSLRKGAFLLQ